MKEAKIATHWLQKMRVFNEIVSCSVDKNCTYLHEFEF